MKVFLLGGAGRTGRRVAEILVEHDLISEIAVAGRNLERAEQAAAELGAKAQAVRADVTEEEQLASLAGDYDIVVNTAGPDYEVPLPAIRAAIRAGTHYCDIGADAGMTLRVLELDAQAQAVGITAIIGIGWVPGVSNLMGMHAVGQLDETDELEVACVAPPPVADSLEAAEILRSGRANASLRTMVKWLSGRVRTYRDGRWVDVDPFENGMDVAPPQGGVVTAYPMGSTEPITLPRFMPSVPTVSVSLSWFPPQLNELFREQARRIAAGEVTVAEAALSSVEALANEPERWLEVPEGSATLGSLPAVWVTALGRKEGRAARYSCWPATTGGITASALTVAVLKILGGEIEVYGVMPPEACFEPLPFIAEVAQLLPEPPLDGKLLAESLEFLG